MAGQPAANTPELDSQFRDLPFESLMSRLEGVVHRLEEGDLPLEEALRVFEEGVALSRLGAHRLDEAERRIEVLLTDGAQVRTAPFEKENGR